MHEASNEVVVNQLRAALRTVLQHSHTVQHDINPSLIENMAEHIGTRGDKGHLDRSMAEPGPLRRSEATRHRHDLESVAHQPARDRLANETRRTKHRNCRDRACNHGDDFAIISQRISNTDPKPGTPKANQIRKRR